MKAKLKALKIEQLADSLGGFCWSTQKLLNHGERLVAKAGNVVTAAEVDSKLSVSWSTWNPIHRHHLELWHSLLPDSPALNATKRILPISIDWKEAFEIYDRPQTVLSELANQNEATDTPATLLAFELLATEMLLGRLVQQLSSLRLRMRPLAEAPELRITREILDSWVKQADEISQLARFQGYILPQNQPLSTLASNGDIAVQITELAKVVILKTRQ